MKQFEDRLLKIDDTLEKEELNQEKLFLKDYKRLFDELTIILSYYFKEFSKDGVFDLEEMKKFNRMQKMQEKLLLKITEFEKQKQKKMKDVIKSQYEESFYQTSFILEGAFLTTLGISLLTKDEINEFLQNDSSGLSMNERLKKNAFITQTKIKEGINQNLYQGISLKSLSNYVSERLNVDYNQSMRFVRTENTRARNEGHLKAYKKAEKKGLKLKKKWISTLDSRTRKGHQKLDGKEIAIDDYFKIGSDKGLHPGDFGRVENNVYCRCRIITITEDAELETRMNRNKQGFSERTNYKNYKQWLKERN